MTETPLYNSRIVKSYFEYIRKHHPDVDAASIFRQAGVESYQLEDEGYWLTQAQVNRLHEIFAETLNEPAIARKVGQYMPFSKASSTVTQFMLGFLTPAAAYMVIPRVYRLMSRALKIEARQVGDQHVELTAIQNPGVNERPFQCENRLGILEGIAKVFTGKDARIEHDSCMHKSGNRCVYQIYWEEAPSLLWKRIVRYGALLTALAGPVLILTLPALPGVAATLAMLLVITAMSSYQFFLEREEIKKIVENQSVVARDLIDEINVRYNNAVLVQEISQTLASILDTDRLLELTLAKIEKRMDFNRGLIMLTDRERTRLVYRAGFGYTEEEREALQNKAYLLVEGRETEPFITSFLRQKAFLVNNPRELEKSADPESMDFLRRMGVKSFICVPIIYEGQARGILTVENKRSRRQMQQSDLSLLSGIALQIGGSIHSSETYELVRKSEERFRALIHNLSDVISLVDAQGRFTYNSPAAERIFGYTAAELAGKSSLSFIHPEDVPRAAKEFAALAEGTHSGNPVQIRFLRADGAWRSLEALGGNFLEHPGINSLVITSRDITERIEAERELRESEAKLQAVFNEIGAGIVIVDRETKTILEANRTAIEMTGLPQGKIIGRHCRDLFRPTELDGCPVEVLGWTGEQRESRLLHADGRHKDILKTVYPFVIKGRACYLESFVDISDRKRAESLLRESEERLRRAEKMEALGTLAGGVAHDLNNVLGVIVGYAELSLRGLDPSSPVRTRLMNVMKGGERAAAIVQDLLTLARRGVSTMEVLNLNDLIEEIRQAPECAYPSARHPATRIRFDLAPDLLNMRGSSSHIYKSILNLIANAKEAMPSGGVLTIRTANRYLDKPIRGYDEVEEGDYVVLSVSDTGEGISPKDLKHIFEPFYTKKVMGKSGTGLGLAVVWGTVKDHRGYIDVESEVGGGSAFTLYFPVVREGIAAENAGGGISEYLGKGETILVVDDVEGQRHLAAEMLGALNYRVETAAGGEEALLYLREHEVDLLVLDMIMDPGMDGLDTYRQAAAIRPGQKAIIVSGFSESERVRMAQEAGAGAFVRKPYVLERLGTAARRELDR
ncbi:MAG: PAS domain S-box protein [Pseudomonadota bacterium]|nr:PAS domain S-box protein [Pseudomonadota bacterium]